MSMPEPA
jgi:hypothetical protein